MTLHAKKSMSDSQQFHTNVEDIGVFLCLKVSNSDYMFSRDRNAQVAYVGKSQIVSFQNNKSYSYLIKQRVVIRALSSLHFVTCNYAYSPFKIYSCMET